MSAALKNLARQQHGRISLKAFLDHRNYCESGLMSEDAISERIMRQMRGHGLLRLSRKASTQRKG